MASDLSLLLIVALVAALSFSQALARDPGALQDFCVADSMSKVIVNGFTCKNPELVKVDDFFLSGLNVPRSTMNKVTSNVTLINANIIPGLNTLGISMARVDYAPRGLNPPHIHPRATELQTVLEGSLYVGFITSNPENKLVTKVLNKGDVFVFPQGLIHFQFNLGRTRALAMSFLSSQNPGLITIANTVFGSKPNISDDILSKAFQVDKKTIDWIQSHSPILITLSLFNDSMASDLSLLLVVALVAALSFSQALARDPGALQDFCVADSMSKELVKVDDFFLSGLNVPRSTVNKVGSNVTLINANIIPGLNTLGISMARVDYAPRGLNPPHIHPRATELQTVLEGSLYVGFITSNPENKLVTKVLNKGDVFVFPQGLIHFQFNLGRTRALAMSFLSSQNPGVITIANTVFGSKPNISDDILSKAFQVDKKTIDWIQSQF
ncbi:hypothetical protein ZIOFF_071340 [Zingiber officinale]|uniref:Cupin type-1 domain-containing protein n=1 Tax=Zingiber officinale TaxID=94328 RepID=A0A8J5C0Y8_ZINOF|nr:hypothetical protein ZIOFF_071340 [Zingiber officinale]